MSKKQKTESGPSKFAQPFITRGANTLDAAYGQNAGKIQGYTDDVVGTLLPSLTERYKNGDAGVNAARDYGTDVMSGKYLTQNNPYFDDMLSNALGKSTNATQAALGLRGLTGGSDYAGIIADRNSQTATNLAYNDYARERGSMDAAAGRAGSIAAADYLPVGGLLSTLQASQTPLNAAQGYAGSLGGLLGGYQSGSQKPGTGQVLGDMAQTAAMALMMSERRVKRDIQQIGTLPDGLGVYNFRYNWDSDEAPLHTGVMVDEVEMLRPWALGPVIDGIQTVDYAHIEELQ